MFLVDHLWMGWVSLLSGQYRVAFTLCRGAVEAATFEVASGLTPERFEPMWRSGTCTAGRVLASIGKQWPPKLHEDLSIAWKCCRGFGHPSVQPVIFPSFPATLPDGREARAIAFGGDESQPVDEPLLNFLGGFYCIAAEAGVDAMAVSLAGHFVERGRWEREYQALKDQRRIAIVSPGG